MDIRKSLRRTAAASALAIGLATAPQAAQAEDCFLDRDNDGAIDAGSNNPDDDGGAQSNDRNINLACGFEAVAQDEGSTAIGARAVADNFSTVVGFQAGTSQGGFSVAVGYNSATLTDRAIAIGASALVRRYATAGIAIGVTAEVKDDAIGSIAIGRSAMVSAPSAIAFGDGAGADHENSIAIGADSMTSDTFQVSVGRLFDDGGTPDDASDDTAAITRRISNVAAGTEDNDAVTVAQLNPVADLAEANAAELVYFDVGSGGTRASANGEDAIAIGENAEATRGSAIAIGGGGSNGVPGALASSAGAIAIGGGGQLDAARASAIDAVAIGTASFAAANQSVALGFAASTDGAYGVALGVESQADSTSSVAVGDRAEVGSDSDGSVAIGLASTVADGAANALALGSGADAAGRAANAIGNAASAQAAGSTAIGFEASVADDATMGYALGGRATVTGERGIAVGNRANSGALHAVAFGNSASSAFAYSYAFGYGAASTRANQFMFGSARYTYTMPGLPTAASNSRQSGETFYVTVDASGNLGYTSTPPGDGANSSSASMTTLASAPSNAPTISSTSSDADNAFDQGAAISAAPGERALRDRPVAVAALGDEQTVAEPPTAVNTGTQRRAAISHTASLGITAPAISAVTDAQFSALSGRVATLEGRVDALGFQLSDLDDRTRGGIASAMAMGGPAIAPGKAISLSMSVANYRGEQAIAGSLTGQIAEDLYLSAGVSGNTADGDIGTRATVLLGF